MTVKELYEYAKEKGILDYEIIAEYNDYGYRLSGGYIAKIDEVNDCEKSIMLCEE